MKSVSKLMIIPVVTMSMSGLGMSGLANAATAEMSGFADITYVLSDGISDSPSASEGKFDVAAELDVKTSMNKNMSAQIDLDFNLTDNSGFGSSDSGRIEQGFFSWKSPSDITVMGGVFNNPLGWEAEDAPGLYQISHGQIYNLWDSTTDLYGNNLAGVAVSAAVGPINVTGALVNDLGNVAEEQSLMAIANYSPENIRGLELEVGFVSQDLGMETIIDINGTFQKAMLTFGGELMLPSELVDFALGVTGSYKINDQISVTGRFDDVSYDAPGVDDAISITFAASYLLDKNLVANIELRFNDSDFTPLNSAAFGGCSVAACDGEIIQLEAIATF